MRKIKFRAWDKNIKSMINKKDLIRKYSIGETLFDCSEEPLIDTVNNIFIWEDNLAWLQYTGLKDKNGKEIYEGDIVSIIVNNVNKGKYEIKWNEYKWYPFSEGIPPIYTGTKLEVIGNIYENPDLLTFEKTKGT